MTDLSRLLRTMCSTLPTKRTGRMGRMIGRSAVARLCLRHSQRPHPRRLRSSSPSLHPTVTNPNSITMLRPAPSLRSLALSLPRSKPTPTSFTRTYAAPAATPRPSASSPGAAFIVFDRQAKLEQRNLAASDKERSRLTDYVKDQVAGNMVDRLLVSGRVRLRGGGSGGGRGWEGHQRRGRILRLGGRQPGYRQEATAQMQQSAHVCVVLICRISSGDSLPCSTLALALATSPNTSTRKSLRSSQ